MAHNSQRLLDSITSSSEIRLVYSDQARLQRMLDFEAALARVEARLGLIPAFAGAAIASQCQVELIDLQALARAAEGAGNLAIPMVRELTRLVGRVEPEATRYIHWGATSQDAIDTGALLQLRDALDLVDADLASLCGAFARYADTYRLTPMPGRTLMLHALPVTFGLKAARWLDALVRHRERLAQARERALVLQFGGAAGTLASLGRDGLRVAEELGRELGLPFPTLPWHAERDRFAEIACNLGLVVQTLGKIARDIALCGQTDIGEVAEFVPPDQGGSSSLPHKRNPIGLAAVLAASTRMPGLVSSMLTAMVQEHERGLGNWQAEWSVFPEIVVLAAGAIHRMAVVAPNLEVDAARMWDNLGATRGMIMAEAVSTALAVQLGRTVAHRLVEEACRSALARGVALREELEANAEIARCLSGKDLDRLFDPRAYLGMSNDFVDRALAAWEARSGGFPEVDREQQQ